MVIMLPIITEMEVIREISLAPTVMATISNQRAATKYTIRKMAAKSNMLLKVVRRGIMEMKILKRKKI